MKKKIKWRYSQRLGKSQGTRKFSHLGNAEKVEDETLKAKVALNFNEVFRRFLSVVIVSSSNRYVLVFPAFF